VEHALAARGLENYLTNPINVYRLMKRLHTDWPQLENRAQQMSSQIGNQNHHHHHHPNFMK